ncbi:hypothetical protein PAXINDRAFT_14634 [Paxillus involutus ATCC 200175]|uniref:Cytochrome P450 n=1 Tax=Paxillus involutus ATCC 200175 TaxID=664439 RepID=A0A0C9TZ26_PAXIN|nr:hypothetical protein PAXINDRAFT_14634 [Paxillus involutus ATCC 200175]
MSNETFPAPNDEVLTIGSRVSMRVNVYIIIDTTGDLVAIRRKAGTQNCAGVSFERTYEIIQDLPVFVVHPRLASRVVGREARDSYEWAVKMVETPYQYVQKRMESSQHPTFSMVSDHITRMQKYDEQYRSDYTNALKHASASAFLASTETTSSSLIAFTLAMVENPHVWKRAQAEIDSVIEIDRLPEFDDRTSLPYVEAILGETMRWQPVVPLGIPHATTSSDVYKGFYIPKGMSFTCTKIYSSRPLPYRGHGPRKHLGDVA